MNQICISIRAKNISDLKKQVIKNESFADLFEVWIDQFQQEIQPELIKSLSKKPLILVNKSTSEQGRGSSSVKRRINTLKKFAHLTPKYIDVSIKTPPRLIEDLKKSLQPKTKLILSYHNFTGTPSLKTLQKLLQKALKSGADLVKIVPFANQPTDNLIIFELLAWAKKKKYPMIGHCMGENGIISRVMAPELGSQIVYIATDKKNMYAPGKLTLTEYKKLQQLIFHK